MNVAAQNMQERSSIQRWDAKTLLADKTWRRRIPSAAILEFLALRPTLPNTTEAFVFDAARQPALMAYAREIKESIIHGTGVVLSRGLSDLELSEVEQQIFYTAFGYALGNPMTQYGLLYPIMDRGVDYTKEAVPVSMTNAETAFHTDSSSIDVNPDILGLLCENPSSNGGESQVVNALAAYEQMQAHAPDAAKILKKSFLRDVVTPGKDATRDNLLRNCFPIFSPVKRSEGVHFRYMRYWIEKGHNRAGLPLGKETLTAMDTLDAFLTSPSNVVSFQLEKGDIIWINNKTIAHNRTAYSDTEDNIRKLQRMWIETPQ
ncbi:TauD/TfdA family dioxygenase [Pseudomonadota bacterium]